jgi:diaminohydroxyphosphoribosylaminopyrimidine deaminase/5-amino-6-(5-phosphoribosylamino)uracil reductase
MSAPGHSDTDEQFMRRALRLAMIGRGRVEPNPMVGCVIVRDGAVIGEGYHEQFGGPHAEPNALADCIVKDDDPRGATAYVTLEPCCHTNKKTPPCAPRLIEAGVARVVIGCLDPNPDVNGNGVAALRAAGIRVDGPVPGAEAECRQLIAPFIARTQHSRPYVTLKWAQTADGKIAGPGGKRLRISNDYATRIVHRLRARCDAILVGVNTVIADDPLLTARGVPHARPPARIVLDRNLRTPADSRLVRSAQDVLTLVLCEDRAKLEHFFRLRQLDDAGVVVGSFASLSLAGAVGALGRTQLPGHPAPTHLLVEPGPTLAAGFFADNLADRVWVLRSPTALNELDAPSATPIPPHFVKTGRLNLDGDTLTEYLNPQSPLFFAPSQSADFLLTAGEVPSM